MDTIQIHHDIIMHAAGKAGTRIDVQGYAVTDHDSLYATINGIQDSLYSQAKAIEDIGGRLNDVYEYGIGFHDAVSIIAFPLIIALFAFAFPFLFTVITHINNKYGSRHISDMFRESDTYARFWKATKISIFYILIYGLISLMPSDSLHSVLSEYGPWLSLIIASLFAFSIFQFVKTCIAFNDPIALIGIIDDRHICELNRCEGELTSIERKLKYNRYKFWKSDIWKKYVIMGYGMNKNLPKFKVDEAHVNRIIDLCKYALMEKDQRIFAEVMHRMNLLYSIEKKKGKANKFFPKVGVKEADYMYLPNNFFSAMMDFYLTCDQNDYIEERLLMYQMFSLNQSMFPSIVEIIKPLKHVILALRHGRTGLYEKYVRYSAYLYNYIMRMQEVSYVIGENEDGQKATLQTAKERWLTMREIFYVVAAYLFSIREYLVMKSLVQKKSIDNGRLYPMSGAEILSYFDLCKQKQNHDGGFRDWSIRDLIGEDVEREMLERYTVFRLLLTEKNDDDSLTLVSQKKLGRIRSYQKRLGNYAQGIKNDQELILLFPQINKADFDYKFKMAIESLDKDCYIEENSKKNILVKSIESLFCNSGNNTIYDADVNAKVVDYFKDQMKFFLQRVDELGDGLNGTKIEGKNNEVIFGKYTPSINKYCFLDIDYYNFYFIENEYKRIFRERYKFMLYSAISGMKIKEVQKNVAEFGDYVKELAKDPNNEYVIIDTNSYFEALLHLEMVSTTRDKYMGVDYFRIDWERYPCLRDNRIVLQFEKCLLVMNKKDLPVIECMGSNSIPLVTVTDVSNKEEGTANVYIEIDPMLKMRYNPKSEVVLIKHKPMNLA